MADLDQDNKLLEDQEEGPPCLLTRAGRDCRGDQYGAVACGRCGWKPREHERRVRLPMKENEKGLMYMDVQQPKPTEEE